MIQSNGILLKTNLTNYMQVNGEEAWFMVEENTGSTGYTWCFHPDQSGVYRLTEEIHLSASVNMIGVPGMMIWKFKALKKGRGVALFELVPPWQGLPVKLIRVDMQVI